MQSGKSEESLRLYCLFRLFWLRYVVLDYKIQSFYHHWQKKNTTNSTTQDCVVSYPSISRVMSSTGLVFWNATVWSGPVSFLKAFFSLSFQSYLVLRQWHQLSGTFQRIWDTLCLSLLSGYCATSYSVCLQEGTERQGGLLICSWSWDYSPRQSFKLAFRAQS